MCHAYFRKEEAWAVNTEVGQDTGVVIDNPLACIALQSIDQTLQIGMGDHWPASVCMSTVSLVTVKPWELCQWAVSERCKSAIYAPFWCFVICAQFLWPIVSGRSRSSLYTLESGWLVDSSCQWMLVTGWMQLLLLLSRLAVAVELARCWHWMLCW